MAYKPKAVIFLKNVLGNEGFEELQKFEIYKKSTNTTLNPKEIELGLQIVPRTILGFLQKELGSMKENEGKKIKLPIEEEAYLDITKFSNDVYSGEIQANGKVLSIFRYRSLPGVGLVITSAFELYEVKDLVRMGSDSLEDKDLHFVQNLIDEKLRVRDLVSKVIDEKLSQRDAINEMVNMKLSQMLKEAKKEEPEKMKKEKQPLKLKSFLEKKTKKASNPSYEIKIEKSENVSCPDCGNKIFDSSGFSGCICFGPDRNKKIHIRKSEQGVSLSFSNTWDKENIEMLLEVLRERNNRRSK